MSQIVTAHLNAATARLLDLIRDFDAGGGWGNGFRSCAAWLSWRVGLDPGTARERVRVARGLGALARVAEALARGQLSYAKVRTCCDSGHRRAAPRRRQGRHRRARRAYRPRLAAGRSEGGGRG